jgi:hypothetical protein
MRNCITDLSRCRARIEVGTDGDAVRYAFWYTRLAPIDASAGVKDALRILGIGMGRKAKQNKGK